MQILHVKQDGEVHEIFDVDKPIKELLDVKESYILNDDEERIVYLWKGMECSVRSKFIGANKLQEVRGQVGLNYKSISMDADEMDGYPMFISAIENPREDGFAHEIIEEDTLQFEVGGGPSKQQLATKARTQSGKYNSQIQQSGPMYTGGGGGGSSAPMSSGASSGKSFSEDELKEIIKTFDEEGIPDGYQREMVVMGDKAFSIAQKVQTFLGKKQIQHELEAIDSLPEGVFFAEGYVPRVLVQDKVIIGIEFLKKIE